MHQVIRKRGFIFTQVDKLSLITLISSLSAALVGTIWAIYLESILKNPSYVGFVTTFFTVVAMISAVVIVPFIEKYNKTKIYLISIILYSIAYLSFAFLSNVYAIITIGATISILATLKITSFGIILRDKSKDSAVSKNVSLVYTFINIAWIIGPLIAGFIAQEYGINKVFMIAAGFSLLTAFLFASFRIQDNRTEKKIDKNLIKLMVLFMKDKNRRITYILSGAVNFWWALIYIYMPIYIIETGLGDNIVGYFLFAIVIPLVALEYYFGRVTAKKGFKKMFFLGFIIPTIFAISCFFLTNIYYVMGALVLASIGIAMVEPTTEAYFFDIITKQQRDKFYAPYNTGIDVAGILSTFLSAIILMFFPFKVLFLFFGLTMLAFAILSLRVKEVVEGKKKR